MKPAPEIRSIEIDDLASLFVFGKIIFNDPDRFVYPWDEYSVSETIWRSMNRSLIAVSKNKIVGTLIAFYHGVDDKPREAEVRWFGADDSDEGKQSIPLLIEAFVEIARYDRIPSIKLLLPAASADIREQLLLRGFLETGEHVIMKKI